MEKIILILTLFFFTGFSQVLMSEQFDGARLSTYDLPEGFLVGAKGGDYSYDSLSIFNEEKHFTCSTWLVEPMFIFDMTTREFNTENVDSIVVDFEYWSDSSFTFIVTYENLYLPDESDTSNVDVVYHTKLSKGVNKVQFIIAVQEEVNTQQLTFTMPTISNIKINQIVISKKEPVVLSLMNSLKKEKSIVNIYDLTGRHLGKNELIKGQIYICQFSDGSKSKIIYLE